MIEIIQAIAGLFPLVAALVILILGLIYHKPLTNLLLNLSKLIFKRGDTELSVETLEKQAALATVVKEGIEAAAPPELPQNAASELAKPDDPSDWIGKMWIALNDHNIEAAEEAYKMLQASVIDAKQKLSNEIIYYYLRFTKTNDRSAISNIEKIAERHEGRSLALFWLSMCYQFENAFEKAKSTLKLSLEAATTEEEKANRAKAMVDLLLKMESPVEEAFEILSNIMRNLSRENHVPIYLAYAEIYKKTENNLLRAISLEKAIDIDSSDSSVRFNAALAQSEAGLPALAITNYETVLRQKPDDAATLNNLGVVFAGLGMPIQAVGYYTESANRHETLAMSNLAYKFIGEGFVAEAEDLLKKAQQEKVVDPTVSEVAAFIAKQKKSESKKKDDINKTGIKQKAFLRDFADARFNSDYQQGAFSGKWKFGSELVTIEEKDRTLIAEWGTTPKKRRFKGKIESRSASITFENQIAWMTTQESFTEGEKGLCYIDSNRKTIHLMTLSKDTSEFMDLILESNNQETPS